MHVVLLSDDGLKLKIYDISFQLINVYSPNNPSDRKRSLRNLTDAIDVALVSIVSDDFNCAFDFILDRSPSGNPKIRAATSCKNS